MPSLIKEQHILDPGFNVNAETLLAALDLAYWPLLVHIHLHMGHVKSSMILE